MDNLLKQTPQVLADEKTALFSLIDRFIKSVEIYRKEYDAITSNRNADLQKRESDGRNVLNKLAQTQAKEKQALLDQLNVFISGVNRNIESAKKKTHADLDAIEADVAKDERSEKNSLEQAYQAEQRKIDGYKSLRKQVRDIYREVDTILGQTFTGKNKLEQILANQTIDGSVSGLSTAKSLLSTGSVAEARELRDEIKKITESLPRKVIFNSKRTKLICRLAELDAKLDSAQKVVETQFVNDHKARQNASRERCRNYRTVCNNKKEELINKRDRYIASQNEEMKKANEKYQKDSSAMKFSHTSKYDQQSKHYATQLAVARANWDDQLVQRSTLFVKQMEEEYPASRFNGWMRQFWMHPRNVEDYSKVHTTQMNMLMGIAEVDISGWYKGGSAEAIKKVLTKYIWLFGTNKEAATKAYFQGKWTLPYCISIENGDSILLSYDNQSDDRVKSIVNAIGMRLLRSVPACMMRFQLFDADGIGAFGRLMALDPANGNNPSEPIVKSIAIGEGGKVHSSDIPKQIEETKILMDDLSTHLINYSSLREFNDRNPLSKQIYRPILMMNFPSGLAESEIKMLNAMSMNCRKWGFSMVLAQPDKEKNAIKPELQRFFNELYKSVTHMRVDSQAKFLKVVNPATLTEKHANIYLYGLPANGAIDSIAAEIREKSVEASSVKINFAEAKGIYPEENQKYNQKADAGIVIPVGYLEGGQPFKMQFDDKHVHSIIMGNTGSGKTNLLHVMMTNLMLRYDPSEVMVYLIDFKYGLDFRVYTQYNLPNFRSISITNDPEFALAMLEHLEEEQRKRSAQMGSRYQKISDYNADYPNNKMNRIVLIVDELYELVKQAPDEIQKKIIQKIDSFAHQTRAFGLHMVISGQDLDKIDKFETIKNQCTTRLALHCEDEQVKLLMSEEGVARMHTIDSTDQGACVFSLSAGKNPQIEHTALLVSKQQDRFLREIHEHYLAQKRITNVKVLLTRVSDNPNHRLQMFVDKGFLPEASNNKMYVGDPVSLDRELNFHPQENVWIAGGSMSEMSSKAANSLMMFSVLSLTMEALKNSNVEIYCTNFNDHPMRSVDEEENDRLGQLTSNFPAIYKYNTGSQFVSSLQYLLNEMEVRQNGSKPKNKAIWWFIARPELMNVSNGAGNVVIDLKELLQEGPKNNIHVVIWTGDVKKAQMLQLNKTLFKERVCMEMSTEESKFVNGEDLKPMPTGFKAVLIGQNAMRFRVYDLPDGKWMSNLFERLNNI